MLLRKLLGQVEAFEVDSKLRTELLPGLTDAGLHHLLPGIPDMPNSVTNGKLPTMTPRHVLMEFHLTLRGSLSGLLKFTQRHITLQTKRTPCLLKVMCLEHVDDTLILWLRKKDKFYITMQVLDMEEEVLRHAIHFQLVHQSSLAVRLENVSRHPTTGIANQWTGRLLLL